MYNCLVVVVVVAVIVIVVVVVIVIVIVVVVVVVEEEILKNGTISEYSIIREICITIGSISSFVAYKI